MFKKFMAVCAALIFPFSLLACEEPDRKVAIPDNKNQCDTSSYRKAGKAQRAVGGTFFTCGGKNCVVTYTIKRSNGKSRKIIKSVKRPGEFSIPKNHKGWMVSSGCGAVYKRRAK